MPQHLCARQSCCQQAGTAPVTPQENIMKRFTVSTMLAAGLFASLLGASGVAHADWEDTQAAPHSEPKICCHYGVGGASKVHMRPMRINGR